MSLKNMDIASLREYKRVVTMTFSSQDEAYEFYNDYAKKRGFSIRKCIIKRDPQNGTITFRRFCCSKSGFREKKNLDKPDRKRAASALSRCGCPVMLCIKLDPKIDRRWVTNYVDVHNHGLASSDTTPFLRSHCSINEAQKAEIVTLGSLGIRNYQILDYTERRSGGYEHRGFQLKNLYNFTSMQERSAMLADDADSVIKYFKERKKADADFFFKYDTEEGHLTSLFWADAQSALDYSSFGDVVVFDSIYQLNRYNMVVVPFLGTNHHWSTIIFACGIVSRENKKSYEWLLGALMEAMYQVRPEAVITDGDLAMREAIKSVLPGIAHRICTWHMGENAKKYIRDSKVMRMFHKLMSKAYSPEEFENKWQEFDDKVSKRSKCRKWLEKIYASKQLWARAFVKNKMFLGMSTNQRSESLNSKIHKYMNSRLSLCKAVQQLERCLTSMRTKEAELDCRSSQTFPVLTTPFYNLEKSAANNYTRKVFAIVREEIEKSNKFVVIQEPENNASSMYIVALKGKLESRVDVDCFVSDGNIEKLTCTCYKLECEKIPCSHVFAVLIYLDVPFIPQCCINERWTKTAKSFSIVCRKMMLLVISKNSANCRSSLKHLASTICIKSNGDEVADGLLKYEIYLMFLGSSQSDVVLALQIYLISSSIFV